jgi:hypothetical protein
MTNTKTRQSLVRRIALFGAALGLAFSGAIAAAPEAEAAGGCFTFDFTEGNTAVALWAGGNCSQIGVRGTFVLPTGAEHTTGWSWGSNSEARVSASVPMIRAQGTSR